VANIGTVAPGGSAGILHVGATNLAVGAIFSAEIGGVNAGVGGYDQLSVVGGVKIGGAVLSLSLIGGFDPVAGTQFVVLNNDGVETALGKFDVPDIFWIAAGNRVFGINYHGGDGNDVAITAEGAMIVGTNGDDIIDVTHTAFGQPTDRDDIIVADGGNDQLNGGGGADKFRIKIWDKNNNDAIVYDNLIAGKPITQAQMDALDAQLTALADEVLVPLPPDDGKA